MFKFDPISHCCWWVLLLTINDSPLISSESITTAVMSDINSVYVNGKKWNTSHNEEIDWCNKCWFCSIKYINNTNKHVWRLWKPMPQSAFDLQSFQYKNSGGRCELYWNAKFTTENRWEFPRETWTLFDSLVDKFKRFYLLIDYLSQSQVRNWDREHR